MRTARLTADLLARKGEARALLDTYGTPLLDPLPNERALERPAGERSPPERVRVSCSLSAEERRRLRILAARRQRPVSELVGEAVRRWLDEHREDCACLAVSGREAPAGGEPRVHCRAGR